MGVRLHKGCRRRATRRTAELLTLFLCLIVADPYARAEGAAATRCKDRAVATEYFNRGNQLYEQKKLDGALAAFRDSRALCPSENNTLNIALLLRELDRPVEALDMLDTLEHDFPALTPENAESVKELRTSLERLVGTVIFDGDYPGARLLIDGKDVGAMPQARPIKVRIGMHTARVEMPGHLPLDTTFSVLPKQNVQVVVVLAMAPALREEHPTEPPALHSFHLGVALSLTPGLGGNVTGCAEDCSAPPGLGSLILAGYRYRLVPSVRIGAAAGYLFLWQARPARLLVDGDKPVDFKGSQFLNALFAGPEVSTSFDVRGEYFDLGFALGPIGGPLVNARTAQDGRGSNGSPTITQASGFGGLFILLQASWRTRWSLAPGWPLHLTLGLLGFAPMNVPEFNASFNVDRPVDFSERLIGSWGVVFTPGLTVYHDL